MHSLDELDYAVEAVYYEALGMWREAALCWSYAAQVCHGPERRQYNTQREECVFRMFRLEDGDV